MPTATAVYGGTEDVVNETVSTLGLKSTRILLGNVRRENIDFDIRSFEKGSTGSYEEAKLDHSAKVIGEYVNAHRKSLVYCPYTTQVTFFNAGERLFILSTISEYPISAFTASSILTELSISSSKSASCFFCFSLLRAIPLTIITR